MNPAISNGRLSVAPTCGPSEELQPSALANAFQCVRAMTDLLCKPLQIEDMVVQSMPDASPVSWHLAHTTWFFETFVLKQFSPEYRPFHPQFEYLFNSYYNAIGQQFKRSDRGLLTRPTVAEVREYRRSVDQCLQQLLQSASPEVLSAVAATIQLGLQHEQQHQELILTDVKHLLSRNPLAPAYQTLSADSAAGQISSPAMPLTFVDQPEQIAWIGHSGDGFSFDNELPRHRQFVESYGIANRLVSNREYLEFIDAGGYQQPQHWLALGWAAVTENDWQSPLYWTRRDGDWYEFTLHGLQPLDLDAAVCHVSYFEADAYARFRDKRLPTEAEWEVAANQVSLEGPFVESMRLHPGPAHGTSSIMQMYGDCWQWTASPYVGYPGYRPASGAIGEYNGKFMCDQHVLRGGSVATSRSHIRSSYRNFFPAATRWQFAGIRLAT